jgi:hypothetical protein
VQAAESGLGVGDRHLCQCSLGLGGQQSRCKDGEMLLRAAKNPVTMRRKAARAEIRSCVYSWMQIFFAKKS